MRVFYDNAWKNCSVIPLNPHLFYIVEAHLDDPHLLGLQYAEHLAMLNSDWLQDRELNKNFVNWLTEFVPIIPAAIGFTADVPPNSSSQVPLTSKVEIFGRRSNCP